MLLLASSVCGLFKWRQFEPEMILLAVGWYLRFSLSYRDVEELLAERGLRADHVTVWRWVQRYARGLERRLPTETQLNQRQLARGRDLHPGQGQVGVFIPRGGFDWGDHRLPSFGQARHRGRQALSGQSLGPKATRKNHRHPIRVVKARRKVVGMTISVAVAFVNAKYRLFERTTITYEIYVIIPSHNV